MSERGRRVAIKFLLASGLGVLAFALAGLADSTLAPAAQVTELVSGRKLAVVHDGTTARVRLPADLVSAKLPFVLKMSAFDMRK